MFSHLYIWLAAYLLCWWIFLFCWRKDYREEMLAMSIIDMIFGPISALIYTKDWWHPYFLYTNFPVKIEDLIFGFSVGGISSVIYLALFRIKTKTQKRLTPSVIYQLFGLAIGLFAFFGLFYFFNISSFWTTMICSGVVVFFISIKRSDLFFPMILSATLLMIIAVPFYLFALHINPHWFIDEWYIKNLSGIYILGIPIEELAWYFGIGLATSMLWKFLRGFIFVAPKNNSQS